MTSPFIEEIRRQAEGARTIPCIGPDSRSRCCFWAHHSREHVAHLLSTVDQLEARIAELKGVLRKIRDLAMGPEDLEDEPESEDMLDALMGISDLTEVLFEGATERRGGS